MSRRSKSFPHSDRIISRGKKAQTNRKKIMVPTTMSKAGWAIIEARDDVEGVEFQPTIPAPDRYAGLCLVLCR